MYNVEKRLSRVLMDNRNTILASNLIKNSINLKSEDNLLIEVIGEDGIDLAKEIEKQAKDLNANPEINIIRYDDLKNIVRILRKEYGGGEVYFDDRLIMKDGKFVLGELKNLNKKI